MNEAERMKLADNLSALADRWTVADLEFVIGVLTTITAHRKQTAAAHDGYWEAVSRSCSYEEVPEG